MPTTPLKIWTNADLSPSVLERLKASVAPHTLVMAEAVSNLHPGQAHPELASADVAFGQPDPQQLVDSNTIKFVQLTSAGYTRYDTPEVAAAFRREGKILSNSSSVYDAPCAQHALAMILALARQLPSAWDAQAHGHRWIGQPIRRQSHLLNGQSILIYGYGAIARQLTAMVQPLGMNITGVRRNPKGDEPVKVVTNDAADELLPGTDHVMDILPASRHTNGFFDATRIARFKPTAIFYNIGRGTTTDQPALIEALNAGKIAAAYLDVTDPEPPPADHPIWSTKNCHITPHAAGGHADEFDRLVDHFLENLRRFAAGQGPIDRIY